MAELILRSGKRAGRRITLAGEAIIGRDEGCRIRLTSSDVSRRHCLLRCDGDEITVADLGSRNGTHVNDIPVTAPTRLRPGDLLRVGPFLFQVPSPTEDAGSDEDISGWLTEEGTEAGGPPTNVKNETTLVPDVAAATQGDTTELKLAPAAATGRMAADPPAPPADPVVAQAATVIREYWAAKKPRR